MRSIERQRDGSLIVNDGDYRHLALPPGMTRESEDAAVADFFGPDLSLPAEVPMDRLRMFLVATNRKSQVVEFLASLPEPMRAIALEEFNCAQTFIPDSPIGRAAQRALKLSDDDFAEAMRDAAAFTIDDYGAPKPGVLAAIGRFLLGVG